MRERESASGKEADREGDREKETQNLKQASVSELSAQSPILGLKLMDWEIMT